MFYPTEIFKKIGFHRAQCHKCKNHYWRKSEKQDVCGDASCTEKYQFIGRGTGMGRKGKKITYSESWKNYEKAFNTARIPCHTIDRYPVVARWRADVDFCAAGIYCFQPYCMTGELDPPANPLICPQFCVRFNDLENVGITGRHYSGFIMLGLQVFNKKDNFIFFKEEVVEFNYRWLTEFLEIDPDEITFIEDVWCGGGNLGPCIEYFVGGLELGNMVFIEYKTLQDGSREKLEVQVVDVGIGLERVSWLINGTPTTYIETFKEALEYLKSKVHVDLKEEIWEKFGPYSSLLDADEVDDIGATWKKVAALCNDTEENIRTAISPIKDLYIVLDHTRTLFMIIYDGSLPSNVGGGCNVRNILRRVLDILHSNKWWDAVNLDGIIELMEFHKKDLEKIYGDGHFKPYPSIRTILALEIERYETTDKKQTDDLNKLMKKNKGVLTTKDWRTAIESWGIPADKISRITGFDIPNDLKVGAPGEIIKNAEASLYDTNNLTPTESLYYSDHKLYEFESTITDIYVNMSKDSQGKKNILILDRSCFYPFSGGQANDLGEIEILGKTIKVNNVEKVGNCVLHFLDEEINVKKEDYKKTIVKGRIDVKRRRQLVAHHTGTHIVFASCRRVLGPHVWQNGAKKTIEKAHLDITHFKSLTYEEERAIENEANKIIMESLEIKKSFIDKKQAERDHGFSLYQGGVVPGNTLRVVNISDTDVEACCGTHCDNTAEVGWIKMLRTSKQSDGIVRLEYVCFERALEEINYESNIINDLCEDWTIDKSQLVKTGNRFFNDFKKYENRCSKQDNEIMSLQLKVIKNCSDKLFYCQSSHENPTFYFSNLDETVCKVLKDLKKGLCYFNRGFVYLVVGDKNLISEDKLKKMIETCSDPSDGKTPKPIFKTSVGKKKDVVEDILILTCTFNFNSNKVLGFLKENGFVEL